MIMRRAPDQDEFVIVACDGIWDVKSSAEACGFVKRLILRGVPPPIIMEELMNSCICADPKETCGIGGDNMTCILVMLQEANTLRSSLKSEASSSSCFPMLCGRSRKKKP